MKKNEIQFVSFLLIFFKTNALVSHSYPPILFVLQYWLSQWKVHQISSLYYFFQIFFLDLICSLLHFCILMRRFLLSIHVSLETKHYQMFPVNVCLTIFFTLEGMGRIQNTQIENILQNLQVGKFPKKTFFLPIVKKLQLIYWKFIFWELKGCFNLWEYFSKTWIAAIFKGRNLERFVFQSSLPSSSIRKPKEEQDFLPANIKCSATSIFLYYLSTILISINYLDFSLCFHKLHCLELYKNL